jgi:hypothetical protein
MPKAKPLPPTEVLRELLHYDEGAGHLMFLTYNHRHKKGDLLERVNAEGYLVWTFEYDTYYAHRLAWKIKTGTEPPEVVDHINRNRSDNRWSNLRAADNMSNRGNVTPWGNRCLPGVQTRGQKFYAKIGANGTQIYLGAYDTEMEAHQAYRTAHLHYWGERSIYAAEPSS